MSCSCGTGGRSGACGCEDRCSCERSGWKEILPDLTTLVGNSSFTSEPLRTGGARTVTLNLERGPILGAAADISVFLEQSRDGVAWTVINGSEPLQPQNGVPLIVQCCTDLDLFRIRIVTGADTRTTLRVEGTFS